MTRIADLVESYAAEQGIEFERFDDTHLAVNLPGEKRLRTACLLTVGPHALEVQAFVMRHADENHEHLYRFLLQRNTRTYAVHWSIDDTGDVYLVGRVPIKAVDEDELDRIFGSVLEYADGTFNTLLELGFGSSITREWQWRLSRGESTRNLEAFQHLKPEVAE